MPELPDVTLYVRALKPRLEGRTLERIRIASPFVLRSTAPAPAEAAGARVRDVGHLAKRIRITLEGDIHVLIHLMIAGRLHWKARNAAVRGKNQLAAFDFDNGTLVLTEAGTKRRAAIHLVRGEDGLRALDRGGADPLAVTGEELRARLTSENHTLKRALTDQRLLAGIGNAYSDEILFAARLSPFKQTRALDDAEWRRLHEAIRGVLGGWFERLAAESGDEFPRNVTAFREGMAVHGRYWQPCPVCGAPIQRIVYAENESNYCARCQTGGRVLADRSLSRLLKANWPKSIDELEGGG